MKYRQAILILIWIYTISILAPYFAPITFWEWFEIIEMPAVRIFTFVAAIGIIWYLIITVKSNEQIEPKNRAPWYFYLIFFTPITVPIYLMKFYWKKN